ncbi:MAG: permease [Planctomycetota bacterium]
MNAFPAVLMGGFIRMVQGLIAASPTLLVGLMIAAIFRYYLGRQGTQRLFGGNSLRRLPQAWLVGMLLPVCSIGVLPILIQMRRFGIRPGALSAFALSAPLFNPLSLLYGLTLSRPLVIVLFAIGSLGIVTALGLFWDAIDRRRSAVNDQASRDEDHGIALIGTRRLAATVVCLARDASGMPIVLTGIGLLGLAVLAAVLPYGGMQNQFERDDLRAPLKMIIVAVPVYATPMLTMSQLGMMFQHANSPGAAFALLILGTGVNFATPFWFARHYGWRSCLGWMVCLLLIACSVAYAINRPLIPPGVQPSGHTHAFDIYANPIAATQTELWSVTKEAIVKHADIAGLVSLAALGFFAMLGTTFRVFGFAEASLRASGATPSENEVPRSFDVIVPPSVLGGTMLVGLVALSVVACYGYYPAPDECLEEITLARAECLSAANSGDREHALFWLPVWEEWSRRLEVGTVLRHGQLSRYQSMQGYLIRKRLDELEHELEDKNNSPERTKALVQRIFRTNSRWVQSFDDL